MEGRKDGREGMKERGREVGGKKKSRKNEGKVKEKRKKEM